jgi:hypothetical protein
MRILSLTLFLLLSCGYLSAQTATWSRMELKGTGLSVETPKAFELAQDKPDPFLEHQVAYIFWRLSYDGIFATITYEKVNRDPKSPRRNMDETAALFAGQYKPSFTRVIDTTFQDQQAALFEEEFFEPYAKKNMRRKMLAFGPPGELTTINFSWPVDDPSAKTTAERIFNSIRRAGAVAAETSKAPPSDWKRVAFNGLSFETPSVTPASDCNRIKSSILKIPESRCYLWGKDFYVKISYLNYAPASAPSPADMLRRYQESSAELDRESTLKTTKESTTYAVTISRAEAVRLRSYTGYGAVATEHDSIFIRKGNEVWNVDIIRPLRWEFAEEAADRIIGSLSLAVANPRDLAMSVPVPPAPPMFAGDYLKRALASFKAGNDKGAEGDVDAALRLDPKMADAYILRAKIYCSQKLIMSAIHDEDKAISLGGKVDYRCGRSPGAVPR